MNNKAFTLIELLAVITVIAVISVITVPVITRTINNSKQSTYDRQAEIIERASENWFIKQSDVLDENSKVIVDIDYLLQEGYLKGNEITSTKTGNKLSGCVSITYSSNQYTYKFSENNCTCLTDCKKYEK